MKPFPLAIQHAAVFREGFILWLMDNEHMFGLFEKLADQLWNSGRRHYSSRTIGEKMRFDHALISNDPSGFKLNNNYTPDLGRLYVLKHPERVMLFSYRRSDSDFVRYICRVFKMIIVKVERDV